MGTLDAAIAAFVLILFLSSVGLAETVTLKNGTVLHGSIVETSPPGPIHRLTPIFRRSAYAAHDAALLATTIHNVGFRASDSTLVTPDPTRATLDDAFKKAAALFERDDWLGTQKFIFYFSGHAGERGLRLKDALLSKEDLHRMLEKIKARTKVVILDSCYAGALATKGIKRYSRLRAV